MLQSKITAEPRPLISLRASFIFANIIFSVLLIGGSAWSIWHSRTSDQADALRATQNLAASLSSDISAELKLVDNSLTTLCDMYRSMKPGETRLWKGALRDQKSRLKQVEALRFVDARGEILAGLKEGKLNVADRDYFISTKDTDQLTITGPIKSRLSGEWSIVLARRATTGEGKFAGIFYAVFTVDHFYEMFSRLSVGDRGAITLRMNNFALVTRFASSKRLQEEMVGNKSVSSALREGVGQSPLTGWFRSKTAIDQVERVTAYQKVEDFPLTLYAGLSTEEFLGDWRREFYVQTALVVLLLAGMWSGSAYLYKQQVKERNARLNAVRLARQQELMLQNELIGILRTKNERIEWINLGVERLLDFSSDDLIEKSCSKIFENIEIYSDFINSAKSAFNAGKCYRQRVRIARKDGKLRWVDVCGAQLEGEECLWMLVDIDSIKQSEERALDLSMKDDLTGLANRRCLDLLLSEKLSYPQIFFNKTLVCYMDLDGFKPINDKYGHDSGDIVLQVVAHRLKNSLRAQDFSARLGGDEFVLVFDSVDDVPGVKKIIERCLIALCEEILLPNGQMVKVGASAGVVTSRANETVVSLLNRADSAMYQAKRKGKMEMCNYALEFR